MKVLTCPEAEWDLTDYGIQVPLAGDRAEQTRLALLSEPPLEKSRRTWLSAIHPASITREDLLRVHAAPYVDTLLSDNPTSCMEKAYELVDEHDRYRRYDPDQARRPFTDLVPRALQAVGATYQAALAALERPPVYLLCGSCGMHHAMKFGGRGFCLLHDIMIAVRKLQAERRCAVVWVIDVDAHKGDGTAAIANDDPTVETLSIHMAKGWPLDGPRHDAFGNVYPWFTASTVDIGVLPEYQHLYLRLLEQGLSRLEEAARTSRPDLAIVVNGSDPYEHDPLESASLLKLSRPTLLERDRLVYRWLKEQDIPQLYLMAGGYGEEAHRIYAQFLSWALQESRWSPAEGFPKLVEES